MTIPTLTDRLQAATTKAEGASQIMHDVANGGPSAEVSTASGPVPSLQKWFVDLNNRTTGEVGVEAAAREQADLELSQAIVAHVSNLARSARTSNAEIGAADKGALIDITGGSFTQTFASCSALSNGWWCYIRNSGSSDITLDPYGSETIDGVLSGKLKPSVTLLIQSTGTELSALRVDSNKLREVFTSSGSWVCPLGVTRATVTVVGGGGGAGGSNVSQTGQAGGGGGAAIKTGQVAPGNTYSIIVGSGGAAGAVGAAGGTSSFVGGAFNVSATGGQANGTNTGSPGGLGSGGDLNIAGGSGALSASNNSVPPALGGSSLFCGQASGGGVNGRSYGGGGSGVFGGGGGSGASGVVVVEY